MYLKRIPVALFLGVSLMHSARPELISISMESDPEVLAYSKVSLERGGDYFVVPRDGDSRAALKLESIKNRSEVRMINLTSHTLLMADSKGGDLLVRFTADSKWIASRIAGARLTGEARLDDFSTVLSAVATGRGYAVGGQDANDNPRVVLLDKNLAATRSFSPGGPAAEADIVGYGQEGVIVVINYQSGTSSLLWLSEGLTVSREVRLRGGAASGILTRDGIAVTYSVGQDVFVEALDQSGRSKYRTAVLRRQGESLLKFVLCSIPEGLALVGANMSTLVVSRIDQHGAVTHTSLDKSGLSPPTYPRYVVSAVGGDVHVLGVAYKKGHDVQVPPFVFHFVDKP